MLADMQLCYSLLLRQAHPESGWHRVCSQIKGLHLLCSTIVYLHKSLERPNTVCGFLFEWQRIPVQARASNKDMLTAPSALSQLDIDRVPRLLSNSRLLHQGTCGR